MEWLVNIALGISGIVIILALYAFIRNIIRQLREPRVIEKAEVARTNREITFISSSGTSTIASSNGYGKSTYFVTFKIESGRLVTFKVKKQFFLSISDHQTGILTYKGYKLLNFDYEGYPINSIQWKSLNISPFFGSKKHNAPVVRFYGEAKELDVNYHSDQAIDCDQTELNRFIDQLINQESDNFFCLQNEKNQILEVSNSGKNEEFELVYMHPTSQDRFLGKVTGAEALKSVIDAYFNELDVIKEFNLSIES
ncbi:MAG: DUF2500 family protein [Bacillota bacterium]